MPRGGLAHSRHARGRQGRRHALPLRCRVPGPRPSVPSEIRPRRAELVRGSARFDHVRAGAPDEGEGRVRTGRALVKQASGATRGGRQRAGATGVQANGHPVPAAQDRIRPGVALATRHARERRPLPRLRARGRQLEPLLPGSPPLLIGPPPCPLAVPAQRQPLPALRPRLAPVASREAPVRTWHGALSWRSYVSAEPGLRPPTGAGARRSPARSDGRRSVASPGSPLAVEVSRSRRNGV